MFYNWLSVSDGRCGGGYSLTGLQLQLTRLVIKNSNQPHLIDFMQTPFLSIYVPQSILLSSKAKEQKAFKLQQQLISE